MDNLSDPKFGDIFNQFNLIEINSTNIIMENLIFGINQLFTSIIKLGQKQNSSQAIIKNVKVNSIS